MNYSITQKTVLRKEMKKFLPESSRLSTKGINEMDRILTEIFERIMKDVATQPYLDFSDYTILKIGGKFLRDEGFSANRKLKYIRDDITAFLDNTEFQEKKKDVVNE